MLRRLIIVFPFLLSIYAPAQDTTLFYFDINWKQTDKANHVYYRKSVKHESGYKVWDFFKNGNIQMRGFYSDHIYHTKQDTFEYFYANGQLKEKGMYNNGTYTGEWNGWFEDGKKNFVARYNGIRSKIAYYHTNGVVSAIEEYEHDTVLISARLWDSTGEVSKNRYIEIKPSINGEQVNFKDWFDKYLYFPEDSQGNKLYGKVQFYIVVDENGKVAYGESYGFVHPEMENMIKRAVKKFPKCTPAIMHNRVVTYFEGFAFNFGTD